MNLKFLGNQVTYLKLNQQYFFAVKGWFTQNENSNLSFFFFYTHILKNVGNQTVLVT